jgi:hypothetical protein
MRGAETLEGMMINPDSIKTTEDVEQLFKEYKTLEDLIVGLELLKEIDLVKLVKYVITLYSDDSILNVRPPMSLDERQVRAIQMSGFKLYDNQPIAIVKRFLIDLDSRQIFEFIFEYLSKQKKFVWQEIITLETQLLENQRLRMRPVDEEKGELAAFEKKGKLTIMYKDWFLNLKEMYNEFYGDNDNLRAIHRINRAEMSSLENLAF